MSRDWHRLARSVASWFSLSLSLSLLFGNCSSHCHVLKQLRWHVCRPDSPHENLSRKIHNCCQHNSFISTSKKLHEYHDFTCNTYMPELPIYTTKTPVKFVKFLHVFIFNLPYHFVLYRAILHSRNLSSLTENRG